MTATGKGRPGSMDPAALARARGELAAARGRRRLDLILDAPDPRALVRALPADEVYFTIRDIGLGSAAEIVRLASARQFRTFLDLDAWRGRTPDPSRILPWLRAARGAATRSDLEAARWKRKLAALDSELLSLVLVSTLRIHDLEEDPDPRIESDRFMRTPEGKHVVEFAVEGADYLAVRGVVDDLYAEDPFQATRILAATRSELRSELEESALRWRTARLADLGYPDLEEALSWFARPPAKPALPAGEPARPPGFFLAQFRRGTLLDRAMEKLLPDERERVELEVIAAANAVMVADAVDVADPDSVRRAVESARAMLELGLEDLGPGGDDRAAAVLSATPLKRVFQHGFGRVLQLRWRAERAFEAGGAGTREAPLLDPPLGEAMAALARRRPLYFPGIEAERGDWGGAAAGAFEPRPFLSSQDLERTDAALQAAEALAALGRKLALAPAAGALSGPPAPRLSALYLTALANERLGRAFRPDPIPASELRAAARALERLDDPRLAAEGEAGALLARLAGNRAGELAGLRGEGEIPSANVTAVLVGA
jgi:Family of unknown function (DUF6178)